MSSITLNVAATVPLRPALYSQLGCIVQELDMLLERPEREESCQAWAACARLREVATLLDQVGWRERDAKTVTLTRSGDVRLTLDALGVQLEVESDAASSAREYGEQQRVHAAEQRCERLHDSLCAVEAAARTAGLLERV